jgi:hypothetical protein
VIVGIDAFADAEVFEIKPRVNSGAATSGQQAQPDQLLATGSNRAGESCFGLFTARETG